MTGADQLAYVDLAAFRHLTRGLTFEADNCAGVLDHALQGLNEKTSLPDQLLAWIQAGAARAQCPYDGLGRIIADVTQVSDRQGQTTYVSAILRNTAERETAPIVMLNMHSPLMDIPMRIEVPMRAVLQGNAPLEGTHTLYQHALLTDRGDTFLYYGITKRGWNLRFNEHARAAMAQKSKRLLARTLNDLIEARVEALYRRDHARPQLAGLVTAICATGLSREAALASEEYLVDKYSLASKHPFGLNMIPGGEAGIRHARRYFRRHRDEAGPPAEKDGQTSTRTR